MKNVRTIFRPSLRLRSGQASIIHRPSPIVYFMAVVLFLCACPASFGTIHWKDGLTHDIDYEISDDVWVDYQTPYMYTTVNWLDGGIIGGPYSLRGYENSRINISGGSIDQLRGYEFSQIDMSGGSIDGSFMSNDSSQVYISGGSIRDFLYSHDSSQAYISGGSIHWLWSYHSSQVDISGGSMYSLGSTDSSQVNISGGKIRGKVSSFNSSLVDISGGSINTLHCCNSSQVNISGGLINGGLLQLYDQGIIKIFGSDFAVDGLDVGYGELTSIFGGDWWDEPTRHLAGTLLSGELIDNDFYIGEDARIVLIPEPSMVLLLGLGGLLMRRRR